MLLTFLSLPSLLLPFTHAIHLPSGWHFHITPGISNPYLSRSLSGCLFFIFSSANNSRAGPKRSRPSFYLHQYSIAVSSPQYHHIVTISFTSSIAVLNNDTMNGNNHHPAPGGSSSDRDGDDSHPRNVFDPQNGSHPQNGYASSHDHQNNPAQNGSGRRAASHGQGDEVPNGGRVKFDISKFRATLDSHNQMHTVMNHDLNVFMDEVREQNDRLRQLEHDKRNLESANNGYQEHIARLQQRIHELESDLEKENRALNRALNDVRTRFVPFLSVHIGWNWH